MKLALEPEAASIWCQLETSEAHLALTEVGTQYMVVDLGGIFAVDLFKLKKENVT